MSLRLAPGGTIVRVVQNLAVLAAFANAGCQPAAGVAAPKRTLRVAAGTMAPLSQPLAAEYARQLPEFDVKTIPSATDSATAIEALQRGEFDLAIVLADAAFEAYWKAENTNTPSLIRGISLLQPLSAYVLVRPGAGIQSVSDLNGRRVVIGPRNTSSANLASHVLEAFEVKADVTNMTNRTSATDMLNSKSIDAVIMPGYTYPDESTAAAVRAGAYFIPIDGPAVERLRWNNPFVRTASIPRGTFPGQDHIIPTVGIDMVVLCHRDLDESLVFQLTRLLFEAYPRLADIEASLKFLNLDEAPATPVPLHAGAARFFRERELAR